MLSVESNDGVRAVLAEAVPPLQREALDVLVDGLLHEARNPLNALNIHVEVLAERLRRELGHALPEPIERQLKSMREQVGRVDATLRRFGDFMAPQPVPGGWLDWSSVVSSAAEVAGCELRRRNLVVTPRIEPGIRIRTEAVHGLYALAIEALLTAMSQASSGQSLHISLHQERGEAVLQLMLSPEHACLPGLPLAALDSLTHALGGQVRREGSILEVRLPTL